MLYAVIMAGGSGTRFWPASRAIRPKQLLDLVGDKTMIQSTLERLGDLVARDRVLVVTNHRLVDSVREQLPDLPGDAILGEPCKRDTAPCIGVAASWIVRDDPDAIMAVMPADHVIQPESAFQATIEQAVRLVKEEPSRLVTFGISPSHASESFGYIERGASLGRSGEYRVQQFREKPQAKVAEQYLAAGRFYWNSGIFVWRAQTILDLLSKFVPDMFVHLEKIAVSMGTPEFLNVFRTEFENIQGTSIDYAVMERAEEVVVVEAPFSWDDVGTWQSLARLRGTDADGNTLVGKCLAIDTKNSIVRSEGDHLIATVGMQDCIVVHTDSATLLINKHDEESVRKIVRLLEERGFADYL